MNVVEVQVIFLLFCDCLTTLCGCTGYFIGLLLAAMSSRKARKPNWAWDASFKALDRMQALYWSAASFCPPGPPEHT